MRLFLHFFLAQVAREVVGLGEHIKCSTEPLADGLNFLSDAYFVKLNDGEREISLFAKVCFEKSSIRTQSKAEC